MRKLGADDVYMYTYKVHPNIKKVLDHYVKKGYVKDVVHISLPGNQPNMNILQHLYFEKWRLWQAGIKPKKLLAKDSLS